MDTQVLLSSVTAWLSITRAIHWASRLNKQGFPIHGLEIMPMWWTNLNALSMLADQNKIRFKGIHFPFWAPSKPFRQVLASEYTLKEKGLACIWQLIFSSAHPNCRAARAARMFPDAYLLFHPDCFLQAEGTFDELIKGRTVFFENERWKEGEPDETHNPYMLSWSDFFRNRTYQGKFMFDPGHALLAQEMGKLPDTTPPVHTMFRELKPRGLHLSFSGGGRLHDLPTPEEWQPFVGALKENMPEIIVIEIDPRQASFRKVLEARKMIWTSLGI